MPMNRMHRRLCSSEKWARAVAEWMPDMLGGRELGDDVLEVGAGFGATTAALLTYGPPRLTALEIDAASVRLLRDRFGDDVRVVKGDGADMPFEDGTFSAVVCFTMLHHIPDKTLQDRLFAEARRVLRPGGLLRGVDSLPSLPFRFLHIGDTMNVIDPATLPDRLERAGFARADVTCTPGQRVMFTAYTT